MPIDRNAFFARTMHTPDSPERAELRAALRELSKALLPLHRALIEAARDAHAENVAAADRDRRYRHAQDHPLLGDEQDLVLLEHHRHAGNLAVALSGLDVDHAEPAAMLRRIGGDRRPFAESVLRHGE